MFTAEAPPLLLFSPPRRYLLADFKLGIVELMVDIPGHFVDASNKGPLGYAYPGQLSCERGYRPLTLKVAVFLNASILSRPFGQGQGP